MSRPFLAVHAHCYQPPRENPWTEEVTREPSAAPFHDWNARIATECYRPNAFARILEDSGRVVGIVNNFERLSFNVGATLSTWLERHDPRTYERLQAAHRATGGAIAQPYVHMILPLASPSHLRTVVRWGLADFLHRFGTRAEGMWLPETAVNDAVLAVLAEEGVGFTVLAPTQARRVRPLGDSSGPWTDVPDGSIDATVPYRWRHPAGDGRGVDVVVYDGPLSSALAFHSLSSEQMVDLASATPAAGRGAGLVCAALDGETFGHHQRFGERALAYALTVEAPRRGFEVGSLSDYLRRHRPEREVEIQESAWSCAHGVGRWSRDCGCSTGPDHWHQRWRAPLRAALDLVRQAVDDAAARRGPALLADPAAALDDYVQVLVGACTRRQFAARHVRGDAVEAFTLLEAQRHALLMYTSCGWFFSDVAGLESVQLLRYAARALDLLAELGEPAPLAALHRTLAEATSNDPRMGDASRVWALEVEPARVDVDRVAAHLVLEQVVGPRPVPVGERPTGGFTVETRSGERLYQPGSGILSLARLELTHLRTGRVSHRLAVAFAVGPETGGAVRPLAAADDGERLMEELRAAFGEDGDIRPLRHLLASGTGWRAFGTEAALPGSPLAELVAQLGESNGAAGPVWRRLDGSVGPATVAPEPVGASGNGSRNGSEAPGSSGPGSSGTGSTSPRDESWRRWLLSEGEQVLAGRAALLAVETALAMPTGPTLAAARSRVAAARLHGAVEALERAQDLVYEALVDGADPALRPLAGDLGLAVEHLLPEAASASGPGAPEGPS